MIDVKSLRSMCNNAGWVTAKQDRQVSRASDNDKVACGCLKNVVVFEKCGAGGRHKSDMLSVIEKRM
jgi:hypothetical protein